MVINIQKQAVSIIRTKLHRPPVARDHISREALNDKLDAGSQQPLLLVSAPAGYGKSTAVSHWLEAHEDPSAWLSLDETDCDLRTFLSYVVAAVQTIFPEACTGY
jgi:LuxR family maltose regulon positive regulatory protein